MPSTCSTGMQRGGSAADVLGPLDDGDGSMPPVDAAARRITADVADDERAGRIRPSGTAATISGPMPQASPIVSASTAQSGNPCVRL